MHGLVDRYWKYQVKQDITCLCVQYLPPSQNTGTQLSLCITGCEWQPAKLTFAPPPGASQVETVHAPRAMPTVK